MHLIRQIIKDSTLQSAPRSARTACSPDATFAQLPSGMFSLAETGAIGFVLLQAAVWIAVVVYVVGLVRRLVVAQERSAAALERLSETLRQAPPG